MTRLHKPSIFVMTLLAGVFVACNGEVDSGNPKDSNVSKSSVTNGKNGDSGTAYQQEVRRGSTSGNLQNQQIVADSNEEQVVIPSFQMKKIEKQLIMHFTPVLSNFTASLTYTEDDGAISLNPSGDATLTDGDSEDEMIHSKTVSTLPQPMQHRPIPLH